MLIPVILAAVLFAGFMYLHSRHRKPLKAAVANMILGVATLILAAPFASASVNLYTVFISLTLGVPGTILVVLEALISG
jgi:hypothetical protein